MAKKILNNNSLYSIKFNQNYYNLYLIRLIFNLSFILSSFYFSISVDILCEFCFIKNYADFSTSFIILFLSFAVVITPTVSFNVPNMMNVVPYLFYRSNDTPPIRHSWKNELVCFYDRPKWSMKGM